MSRKTILKRPGAPTEWISVTLAGTAMGFFVWSFCTPQKVFYSLYINNNLSADERLTLVLFLVVGAVLLVLGWNLACIVLRMMRKHEGATRARISDFLSPGILLGFWPLLNIQALEVSYPIQALCLVIVMLAVLFLISRRLFTQTRLAAPAAIVEPRWAFSAVLVLCCGYAAFFGLYTVSKHMAFHSYAFDLGWQNQALYTLLHTGNPRITAFITVNHFSFHFQPLYYLLAPIYAVYQDPITLLIVQAVLLPAGAVPLFLLARRKPGSSCLALIVALVFLLSPAMHGVNTYDFHGLVLLIPIVCFLLYFLETGRMKLYWLFFALALIVREDASISLVGIGLYIWLALKSRSLGLASLCVCVGYFLVVSIVMTAMGGSPNLQNYWTLGLPEHQDFVGVALTLLTNPAYVFRHIFFNSDKIIYLLQILVPVLLLPLFSGRKLILRFPGWPLSCSQKRMSNTQSGFTTPHISSLHYSTSQSAASMRSANDGPGHRTQGSPCPC